MTIIRSLVLGTAATLCFAACGGTADNKPANTANAANSNANAAKPAAAAPTKDALMTLEKSAYEAWKTKDSKFWDPFLTANFVGYGMAGRLDRVAAIKEYSGADCDVKSYSLSDDQMMPLGNDAAVITYKATVDATCGGKKVPPATWAAGVYVREGDKWKGAFHAEAPVVDPNAPPAKAGPAAAAAKPSDAKPDALTEALMAVETKGWDAWKARDAKGIEAVMAKEFLYLSDQGRRPKAEALKGWSEPKCQGLSYSFSEPMSVSTTKDLAVALYKADVKGTCDGKPVPPAIWVASFNLKEGDNWRNAFYMDLPR